MLGRAVAATTIMFSYADWCAPCQILRPKLEAALETVDRTDIEVIYLDFTELTADNFDEQFSRATPLAPEDFILGQFVKTGFAYVVIDGGIAGELRSDMSIDEITETLRAD